MKSCSNGRRKRWDTKCSLERIKVNDDKSRGTRFILWLTAGTPRDPGSKITVTIYQGALEMLSLICATPFSFGRVVLLSFRCCFPSRRVAIRGKPKLADVVSVNWLSIHRPIGE